jgi:hypothetical protein
LSPKSQTELYSKKKIDDSEKRIKNFIGFSQVFMDENKSKNQALLQVGLFTL